MAPRRGPWIVHDVPSRPGTRYEGCAPCPRPVVNGAERLCAALHALGVECAFGLPGTQNIALYEALRRSRIRSVVPTHELAGSFMANGYYRASGRIAALVTIPGPGFAYAVPGLAEARHDSAAVLHIVA